MQLAPIRSFMRREGRNQKTIHEIFQKYWSQYGIALENPLDLSSVFQRNAERILEIGFGEGSSLLQMAKDYPLKDFIGIEVYKTGISKCLVGIEQLKLSNLRLIQGDAVEILHQYLPNNTFSRIQLFFPDPWPKRKHHKRRLVQPSFVKLIAEKLKINGVFHVATDWEDYAVHVLEVMQEVSSFHPVGDIETFMTRPDYRPLTKFEVRGQRLGHRIVDIISRRL